VLPHQEVLVVVAVVLTPREQELLELLIKVTLVAMVRLIM
jgi:hypothetical protein